jgi:hypothetical protein
LTEAAVAGPKFPSTAPGDVFHWPDAPFENLLQTLDHGAGRALLQSRHRRAVGKCGPGLRADDSIDDQTGTLLKFLDRSFGRGTEDAVDDQAEIGSASQRPLEPANRLAGGAWRYRRLTRICHINPL